MTRLKTDETCASCRWAITDVEGRRFCMCGQANEWLEDVSWNHSCMCYELEDIPDGKTDVSKLHEQQDDNAGPGVPVCYVQDRRESKAEVER